MNGKDSYTIVLEQVVAHVDEETYQLLVERMTKPCTKCGSIFTHGALDGLVLRDLHASSFSITEERPGVLEFGALARIKATINAAIGIGRITKEKDHGDER